MIGYPEKLARVLDAIGGVYLVDDLLTALGEGRMQSFAVDNSVAFTQVEDFPRARKLHIVAMAGDLEDIDALQDKIVEYADANNCGLISAYGRRGWLKPAILDPSDKQKLILAPIEDAPRQCCKILVRPDGSEYFLLECRKKKGFDADLPAEGLLIWRVVDNHPVLEESHGVEGPLGPRVFLDSVPFPSQANRAFTPFTTPSSRAQLGGGLPVHITNIRRLQDGRITFFIGYEYY